MARIRALQRLDLLADAWEVARPAADERIVQFATKPYLAT